MIDWFFVHVYCLSPLLLVYCQQRKISGVREDLNKLTQFIKNAYFLYLKVFSFPYTEIFGIGV